VQRIEVAFIFLCCRMSLVNEFISGDYSRHDFIMTVSSSFKSVFTMG
jgi:hypothetical protein